MRTILVPLDGSTLSEHALPYAYELARLLDARLHLLRVIPDSAVEDGESFGYDLAAIYGVGEALAARQEHDLRVRETLRERAEQYLDRHVQAAAAAGFDPTTQVCFGPPAELIIQTATNAHMALIVMGTHGYGGIRRWALGSTADKVVHAACAPVLLVRGDAPDPAPELRRIVVPLDGSLLARQALPLAIEIAGRAHADVVLLRAIMPTLEIAAGMPPSARVPPQLEDMTEPMRTYAQQELDALADHLHGETPHVATLALIGSPADLIVDEAAARNADLIVMATHGHGGLRRWALGSTTDKVLHATRTPVLLVRARA